MLVGISNGLCVMGRTSGELPSTQGWSFRMGHPKPVVPEPKPKKPLIPEPKPDKPLIPQPKPNKPLIPQPMPNKPLITGCSATYERTGITA